MWAYSFPRSAVVTPTTIIYARFLGLLRTPKKPAKPWGGTYNYLTLHFAIKKFSVLWINELIPN
jgi:hypothetical protein